MTGLVWDERWEVVSGIGRFSREVRARLGVDALGAGAALPTSPRGVLDLERAAVRERRRGSPRALVCPGFMAPLRWPAPTALVVHDLMHRDVPGEAGTARRLVLDTVVRRAARSAAVVLTVSEHSRGRILEWAGLPEERVVTVGNGVSEAFRPDGPARDEGRPYVLYVGNHKPHKNLPRMLAAAATLDPDVLVLLSGRPTPETGRLAEELGLRERLRFLGPVDDDTLAAAYRGASATLVLSTHEGFGFPALEAMACGSPVVTSPVTSLPEVVGDCGLYADPHDVDAMAAAMRRAVEDTSLAARLRVEGPAHAAAWTWENVSARVGAALRERLPDTLTRSSRGEE